MRHLLFEKKYRCGKCSEGILNRPDWLRRLSVSTAHRVQKVRVRPLLNCEHCAGTSSRSRVDPGRIAFIIGAVAIWTTSRVMS